MESEAFDAEQFLIILKQLSEAEHRLIAIDATSKRSIGGIAPCGPDGKPLAEHLARADAWLQDYQQKVQCAKEAIADAQVRTREQSESAMDAMVARGVDHEPIRVLVETFNPHASYPHLTQAAIAAADKLVRALRADPVSIADFPAWARRVVGLDPKRHKELLAHVGLSGDVPIDEKRDRANRIIVAAAKLGIVNLPDYPTGPITHAELCNIVNQSINAATAKQFYAQQVNAQLEALDKFRSENDRLEALQRAREDAGREFKAESDKQAARSMLNAVASNKMIPHKAAVAMFNLENATVKEESTFMANLRARYGKLLRCRKAGNVWRYDPEDIERIAKTMKPNRIIDPVDPTPEQLAARKTAVRQPR